MYMYIEGKIIFPLKDGIQVSLFLKILFYFIILIYNL